MNYLRGIPPSQGNYSGQQLCFPLYYYVLFIYVYFYLFIYLAVPGLSLQRVGSSLLTRDRIRAPCVGSSESWPLDYREFPPFLIYSFTLEYNCFHFIMF